MPTTLLLKNNNYGRALSAYIFTETKLNKNIEELYNIEGYNSVYNSISSNSGGIAIYIKSNIKYSVKENLNFRENYLESLCISFDIDGKSYVVCVVYRRPGSNIEQFMEAYASILSEINLASSLIIGDTNLDLLRTSNSRIVENFVNCNYENAFFPIINRPTRITSHSATVIDHAFCNFTGTSTIKSSIILCHISDHFAIYLELNDTPQEEDPCNYSCRNWKAMENGRFAAKLPESLLSIPDVDTTNLNQSIINLTDAIKCAVESTCPLTERRGSLKRNSKPWITRNICSKIAEKNLLYAKYCKRPVTHGENYRRLRNQVNNLIRQSKAQYYQNLLKSRINDSKKTWDILNTLLNRRTKARNLFDIIKDGETEVRGSGRIAEVLNNYFVNAPTNISRSLLLPVNNFEEYLIGNYPDFSYFDDVSSENVRYIVDQMKITGGGGNLEIPTRVLKASISLVERRLVKIFNLCLNTGYFPDCLKTAHVVSLHKSGDPTSPKNYRPISILSCISKILERLIFTQLSQHFEGNNIINDSQWGFRKGVSTDIAIGKFMERVIHSRNNNEYGLGVFLDLQKAFDLVDIRILINKLSHYGIQGAPLNLLRSFLSNRSQCVKINNSFSSTKSISIGTPQGSTLSPLLFNIFINDFVKCSDSLHFNQYADDTSIFMSDKSIDNLYLRMNTELKKIGSWIEANFLSLNVNKSAYLLFSGRKLVRTVPQLKICNQEISRKSDIKFLGLFIDDKLKWKIHSQYVAGKVSRMFGIICKLKNVLTLNAMRILYISMVHPHLRYGLSFWGSASKTNLNSIVTLQKKLLRLINRAGSFDHSEPLFRKSYILKFEDLIRLEMCKFIFSDLRPTNRYFNFPLRNAIHNYET